MDNNFSRILDIFKSLDEGTMASAEQHKSGPAFTGYWKGTDAGTPGTKMVGGAAESVEQECEQPVSLADKLRAQWEETKRAKGIQEYGAPNTASAGGGPGGTTNATTAPADPKQAAADLAKATQTGQKNLSSLKQAGMNISTGVSSASQTIGKLTTNPTSIPSTQDKKTELDLGSQLGQLAGQVDPSKFNTIVNAIKQAKQSGAQ